MKKKVILLVIFLCTFLFGINVVEADGDCTKEAAQQLAKILYKEVGAFNFVATDEEYQFLKYVTAGVIHNKAYREKGDTIYQKMYNFDRYDYGDYPNYKDIPFDELLSRDGVSDNKKGEMLYIAEIILTGKFNLPKNIIGQASCVCLLGFNQCAGVDPNVTALNCTGAEGWAKEWAHVNSVRSSSFSIYFGYNKNETLAATDVFGNKLSDTSSDYYFDLAQTFKLSDYSKYTSENVCNNNISGGNVGTGDSDLPGVNMHPSIIVPTCENPAILKVIYFINLILDIVRIVVPIGLIIMGMMDFSKAVVSSDEGVQKKSVKLLIKRIIIAVLVFVVPWAVEFIMVNLGELTEDVNFTDCIANANSEDIAIFEEKYEELKKEAEEQAKEEAENNGGNSNSGGSTNTKKDYIIYIGDSRTEGMCNSVTLSSNENCSIAKGGEGYPWLTSYEVSSKLAKILKDNKNSYIVINMGTNSGLSNNEAHKYAEFYNKLAKQYPKNQVVVVSVTQVDLVRAREHNMFTSSSITSDSVGKFNSALKSKLSSDVIYCDVYSKLSVSDKTEGYNWDGVHYSKTTYQKIHNEIKNCLK